MKYIILKAETMAGEYAFPFIFPDRVVHADACVHFKRSVMESMPPGTEVTLHSAGFVSFRNGLTCIRGSETLGIERQPEPNQRDARIFMYSESMGGLMT